MPIHVRMFRYLNTHHNYIYSTCCMQYKGYHSTITGVWYSASGAGAASLQREAVQFGYVPNT